MKSENIFNDEEYLRKSHLEQEQHFRKYRFKHMKQFPELYRSDVSIHPSYTKLKDLPYQVVCRQRLQNIRKQISRQLNREIMNIAMIQLFALDGIRIDRIFSVGMSPRITIVPDFATEKERRRIEEILQSYQSGFLSILYSCGSAPLELWGMHVKNGYIRRVIDEEVKSLALELAGTNVATTYIYCPAEKKKVLGISLPFLIMIIKNMKRYFTFEITILDDKNMHRRFRVSNFQSTTRVRPFCTTMPIGLSGGWNQIQFNLADFTRRAYGSNYIETTRMQIHANCRVRRIYFASRLYSDEELPAEYKLFLPIHRKKCVREKPEDREIKHEKPEVEEPPVLYKTPSEQIIKEEVEKEEEPEIEVPPEVPEPEPEPEPEEVHIPEPDIPIEDEMEEYEIEHEYEIDDRHIFEEEDTAIAAIETAVEEATEETVQETAEEHDEEEDFILNEMAMEDEG
ncbi:hypothetical protein HZH66_011817 [Vespula vulgaris]|uniref:CFA20 domain-containing protein n=1 Tax=Vespula vulgaris TaxID=7454 RepID=A0A834JDF4_VESVU|nr:hypothetical protein HZH66_011817 [Vespula vulgaris]